MNKDFIPIVKSALEEDSLAFEALYNMTKNSAYFVALSITRNEQDAEDILHNSYIKAFKNLESLKSPEMFDNWFNRIVSNTAKDYIKKKKPLLFADATEYQGEWVEEESNSSYIPHESVDNNETSHIIMEIINKLPDDQKLCILMFYYQDMSVADIAVELDLSPSNVKYKLSRAREAIKADVEGLEKKGTKLYGAAPVAILPSLLKNAAQNFALSNPAPTYASLNVAATTTAAATATIKAGFLSGVAGKIVIAAIAVSIVGGVAAAVISSRGNASVQSSEYSDDTQVNDNSSSTEPGSDEVSSYPEEENMFLFTIVNNTARVNGYTGDSAEITVPATCKGIPVVEIASGAFSEDAIVSVHLPDGIKIIGDGAFQDCTLLKNINIPDSVEQVGTDAFGNTPWLESIPGNEIYIGSAFYKYRGEMPANTKLVIKEGTTCISGNAFVEQNNLTEVVLPESVKSIGERAFYSCEGLKSIEIPKGVKEIPDCAFRNCRSLERVKLPDTIEKIGNEAFAVCAIQSIEIPNSVTEIGGLAFMSCSSLKNINIPDSVEKIENGAFENTPWLESISGDEIYIGSTFYKYKGEMPANTKLVIKEGTTYISGSAFVSQSGLEEIITPETVKGMGTSAFAGCSSLKSIKIPSSFKIIPANAFYDCSSLESIDIPDSVKEIGSEAFANCSSLTSVAISAKTLGDYIFDGCTKLTDVTLTESVEIISSDTLLSNGEVPSSLTLHVKAGSAAEEFAKEENIKYVTE